ncbi:MAG TPA: ATP-dependent carboxylate-amine ligase [Candidatus Dormibacteraeota bacterium]|nr:ATP-dependent carboxylate-amine ligase [Candidatus Dormibacteraeota bacterium]
MSTTCEGTASAAWWARWSRVPAVRRRADATPLLVVDDRAISASRPSAFTASMLERDDVLPVLLRIDSQVEDLPREYRELTGHLPTFVIRERRPLAAEVERFRRWCAEGGLEIGHFCCPWEPNQIVAQEFARAAGLPALTRLQALRLRNKVAMKERLRAIGLATADFAPVSSVEDVLSFGRTHGWPVVVKPVDASGCLDTYLVDDATGALRLDLHERRRWMVETFQDGAEYEVCALVFDGTVLDVYPSALPVPLLQAAEGGINGNISMGCEGDELRADLRRLVQAVVDGMALDHGYFHGEVFVGGSGPRYVVGEVALRLPGCEIAANHGRAHGFDMPRAALDCYLGRRPDLTYTARRCVGDLLLPIETGLVTDVTPVERLLGAEGVVDAYLAVDVGERVVADRSSHRTSGFVVIEGSSVGQVLDRMHAVLELFQLTVEPDLSAPMEAISQR